MRYSQSRLFFFQRCLQCVDILMFVPWPAPLRSVCVKLLLQPVRLWVWQAVRCLSAHHCRCWGLTTSHCFIYWHFSSVQAGLVFWMFWMCIALNVPGQKKRKIPTDMSGTNHYTIFELPQITQLELKPDSRWTPAPSWYVHTVWPWHSVWRLWGVMADRFWQPASPHHC